MTDTSESPSDQPDPKYLTLGPAEGALGEGCRSTDAWVQLVDAEPFIVGGRRDGRSPRAIQTRRQQSNAGLDSELVDAAGAAAICGIGRTLWLQKRESGRVPEPIKIGRRVLWSRTDLIDWIDAGAPPLVQWKQVKDTYRRKKK